MRDPERPFLLTVLKCAGAILAMLGSGLLLHLLLPTWLASVVAIAIGMGLFIWAFRGTAFDPSTRDGASG